MIKWWLSLSRDDQRWYFGWTVAGLVLIAIALGGSECHN